MAIIAIDFDGTIVEDKFPKIGKPLPNAIETIKQWKKDGHTIVLWTSRPIRFNGTYPRFEAIRFLSEIHDLKFDSINEQNYEVPFKSKTPDTDKLSPKIYADIYIDDKALGFIPDWNWIKEQVDIKLKELNQ